MRARRLFPSSCIIGVFFCIIRFLPAKVSGSSLRPRGFSETSERSIMPKVRVNTLVIYIFSNTDPEYERNLQFFTQHGMWEGDGCQYVIVVQQEDKKHGPEDLPELPANARYVYHENRCYDLGTVGWAIENGAVDISLYRFVILMNSSSRGPFLPRYHAKGLHWSRVFTARLSKDVKLVGSTISCEAAYQGGNSSNLARHNPHVQSYIMATDQVGMQVLQENGRVFSCHKEMSDAIFYAETGASAAIMDSGYTIDSLMLRYQGIDWRNQSNWDCNGSLNPYAEFAYDGLLLNPLEVLFVKVKAFQVQAKWPSAMMATTYDRWLSQGADVNSNLYKDQKFAYRLSKAITLFIRGPDCFDFSFYRSKNLDLVALVDADALWEDFVIDGQFVGRQFRFTCANPLDNGNNARSLLKLAKAALPQLKHEAFPEGL